MFQLSPEKVHEFGLVVVDNLVVSKECLSNKVNNLNVQLLFRLVSPLILLLNLIGFLPQADEPWKHDMFEATEGWQDIPDAVKGGKNPSGLKITIAGPGGRSMRI